MWDFEVSVLYGARNKQITVSIVCSLGHTVCSIEFRALTGMIYPCPMSHDPAGGMKKLKEGAECQWVQGTGSDGGGTRPL